MAEIDKPKLVLVTYEQSRLEYFRKQLAHQERRLDWAVKNNPSPWECADRGEEVSFYQDVVKMLEGDIRPVVRGKWIKNWHTITCSACNGIFDLGIDEYAEDYDMIEDLHLNFCPSCGAKMDGEEVMQMPDNIFFEIRECLVLLFQAFACAEMHRTGLISDELYKAGLENIKKVIAKEAETKHDA